MTASVPESSAAPAPGAKAVIPPKIGEVITSLNTRNTYTMGEMIGEGSFGVVYACKDIWQNDLAAKVFKPIGTYEKVREIAQSEFGKLVTLRNPFITFVYDAFEYRDTFYIVTERCAMPISSLFKMKDFNGMLWLNLRNA